MVSFPFLIGKVLTGMNEVPSNIIAIIIMFPFLIGKVLTENLFGSYNAEEVFPFLIGKVLTTAFKPL